MHLASLTDVLLLSSELKKIIHIYIGGVCGVYIYIYIYQALVVLVLFVMIILLLILRGNGQSLTLGAHTFCANSSI